MFAEEARLASFSGAASSSKKKQSKADTSAWPHPTTGRGAKISGIPLPAALAKHGFYHTPTDDAPDSVTHFMYPEAVISNWQSGDDPLVKLDETVPGNGWCKIFWSLDQATQQDATWVWTRADLLPTSKELVEARKSTFGTLWPYDGKKGWKPTSKKLAEAGFYFTPTEEEEDSATCVYCKKSLGGWEKGDDPTHEHQKRKPDCPFFNCTLAAEPEPEPEAEPVVEEEADEGIQMPKRGKRAVSTARKPSARAPKSKAAAEPAPTAPETEDEVAPEPEEEPKPPPRSMRAASRRATKAIELINSDTDINRIPRKGEVQGVVQHAATDPVPFPSSEPNYGPLSDPIGAADSKPKRSRSKNKKLDAPLRDPTPQPEAETTVIEHQDAQDDDNESVQEVEEVEEPKRRGRGRVTKASTLEAAPAPPPPTRTRKVSKKVVPTSEPEPEPEPEVVEEVEAVAEEPPAAEQSLPASKSSKSVSTAAPKGKKSKAGSKSTSRRATTAAASEAEGDAENQVVEPLSDIVISDTVSELATAASQATIRASDEDRPARTSRAPLSQLSQLDTLQLDDKQRSMTLGLWLQFKADAAAQEMRQSGLAQLQDLENQMQAGRAAVERALRGEQ